MKRRTFMGGVALGGLVSAVPGIAFAEGSTDDRSAIAGMVQAYFSARSALVTQNGYSSVALDRVVPGTQAFMDQQRIDQDRFKGRRAQFARQFGGYIAADTTTTVLSISTDAARPLARVREATKLYFPRPLALDGRFTGYVIDHDVQFVRDGGKLLIEASQFRATDYHMIPETQFPDAVPPAYRSVTPNGSHGPSGIKPGVGERQRAPKIIHRGGSGAGAAPAIATADTTAGYDYNAMIDYALTYGINPNTDWVQYDDDCTNFVSQCMYAGGWEMVGSWPSDDRTDNSKWFAGSYTWTSSYTWGGAENWYWFATGSGRTYILSWLSDMVPSDVLQYDFGQNGIIDHTQICTDIWYDDAGNVVDQYMTQHGDNYVNRSLNYILSYQTDSYWLYAHRT